MRSFFYPRSEEDSLSPRCVPQDGGARKKAVCFGQILIPLPGRRSALEHLCRVGMGLWAASSPLCGERGSPSFRRDEPPRSGPATTQPAGLSASFQTNKRTVAYREKRHKKRTFIKNKTPRPGFEPGSKAPEAFRISSTLPGQPYHIGLYGIKGQRGRRGRRTQVLLDS